MRLNRPPQAAKNSAPTAETTSPRGHQVRTGLFRVVSVTAVATATCALWALPASAATASAHAKHPSTTSVSFSPTPAWVGQRVRLSAKVKSSGRIPTGTVTFKWAGRTLCVGHLRRGTTSCSTSFGAAGSYLVQGLYSGDATHLRSVGTAREAVRRSPTTTKITNVGGGIIAVGQSHTFDVTVTAPAGTPAPTGTVTFRSGARTLCVVRLSRGTASCVTSFGAAGSYLVKGFYSGNAAHLGSVGTTGVVAGRSPTTTAITGAGAIITVGKSYIFHVTVTSPAGTPAATGTVQLAPVPPTTLSGYTCTAVLTAGVGSCTVTPAEYGIDNYTATYSGNAAHTGSASDGKFTLAAQNVTTTTVTAPSTTTSSVKLNAAVFAMGANITGAVGGTGSVTFYLSNTQGILGTALPAPCAAVSLTTFDAGTGNNNAMCTGSTQLNGLAKGTTVYITAVFSGDPVNVASTSKQFTLTTS